MVRPDARGRGTARRPRDCGPRLRDSRPRRGGAREEFKPPFPKLPDWTKMKEMVAEPIGELRHGSPRKSAAARSPDSLVPDRSRPGPSPIRRGRQARTMNGWGVADDTVLIDSHVQLVYGRHGRCPLTHAHPGRTRHGLRTTRGTRHQASRSVSDSHNSYRHFGGFALADPPLPKCSHPRTILVAASALPRDGHTHDVLLLDHGLGLARVGRSGSGAGGVRSPRAGLGLHAGPAAQGKPFGRALAAALKVLGFAALLASLLEPLLTGSRPRRGANAFAVLADNSQSLLIRDASSDGTRGE